MKILGVITARGGSKGIPRKNVKELCGQPLIAHTIAVARESDVFDRLILSTDDLEIADVARSRGVEVPFVRPAELARDGTPHLPVMQHAVSWLKENNGYKPDAVMLLQPTAPLRRPWHVREAVELFQKKGADSVVGVCETPGHFSPYWAVVDEGDGWGRLFTGEDIRNRVPRRQSFPQRTYYHNGAIYLFRTDLLFHPAGSNFYGEKVALYFMDSRYGINIDSTDDWLLAEAALEKLEREKLENELS